MTLKRRFLILVGSLLLAAIGVSGAPAAGDKPGPAAPQSAEAAKPVPPDVNLKFELNAAGQAVPAAEPPPIAGGGQKPEAQDKVRITLEGVPADVGARYQLPNRSQTMPFPVDGVVTRGRAQMIAVGLFKKGGGQVLKAMSGCPDCFEYVVLVFDPTKNAFYPGFTITADGLEISSAVGADPEKLATPLFTVNGTPILKSSQQSLGGDLGGAAGDESSDSVKGWRSIGRFEISRYPGAKNCTLYKGDSEGDKDKVETITIAKPDSPGRYRRVDNGIEVDSAKVFDTYSLRQMLATTSSQLAGVSGFNQATIFGALGNLQGVSRDTSFLTAQATTVAPASVSSTAVTGGSSSNTLANTLGVNNGTTNLASTITCPPGTLPGVGTSGIPACVAILAGTSTASATGVGQSTGGSSLVLSTGGAVTNTSGSSTTGGQTTQQQNTTTSTSPGVAGVAPTAPASTAFAAPTNLGLSASDTLTEQVQLNSEVTTLQLLLQGALSDQYLLDGSRTVAQRQQTTIGFPISLDPPARFRHAAAEVRIWVDSGEAEPPRIVNLLPAARTYNVARVTSRQNAFGAGVVVDALNVGATTGRARDRLYLAKDTDTVALQYQTAFSDIHSAKPSDANPRKLGASDPNVAASLDRSSQEHVGDWLRQATIWQDITDACADVPTGFGKNLVFGWQFRPVLGADYVQAGSRTVFAQLALPVGMGQQYLPTLYIQTRWREYDESRQVLGAVYKDSCSLQMDPSPIAIASPLRVRDVKVDDLGAGTLKVSATGEFFSSSVVARTGSLSVAPTLLGGRKLEVLGSAQPLLLNHDLNIVGEDGTAILLAKRAAGSREKCGIVKAEMSASPQADGNSMVLATITTGTQYSLREDQWPKPLVLVGAQVYGLHETPFLNTDCQQVKTGAVCSFRFLAATDVLRTARTFAVADLSWQEFRAEGSINFAPTITSLTALTSPSSSPTGSASSQTKSAKTPANSTKTATGSPATTTSTATATITTATSKAIISAYTTQGGKPPPASPNPAKIPASSPVGARMGAPKVAPSGSANAKLKNQTYLVSGFDLERINSNGPCPALPCIEAFDGATKMSLKSINYTPLSPTNALISLSSKNKLILWVYHSDIGDPVVWQTTLPTSGDANLTPSASTVLNEGDSTQITFANVKLSGQPLSLMFEQLVIDPTYYKYDSTKQTLTVLITSNLTSKSGHKDLILTDSALGSDNKPNQVLLPFDVTRR